MGAVEFKMFFDAASATSEQLGAIDEIVVDQAVDKAWEARLKIPVCVNDDGKWDGEDEAWMKAFTRVRVEVNPGNGTFVPLIDGPIVGFDAARSPYAGKSVVTVVVHDDSALLNREAKVEVLTGQTDSALAQQVFSDAQLTPDVDDTPEQPDQTTAASVRRGTPMQYLRDLVRRNRNYHAYVLPGKQPSKSIGCFKTFPSETDGLPDMVLLGGERNIEAFNVTNHAHNPSTVQAATLSIAHDKVQTSSSSYRDATLMGDEPPDAGDASPATSLLPPGQTDRVDLDHATKGAAAESGYSLEATGRTVLNCYGGVLSPYRCVLVKMSDSQYSGKYVIVKVTHTLTRSLYTQAFSMKGNSISAGASASGGLPQLAAGLSVSFNIQASIF